MDDADKVIRNLWKLIDFIYLKVPKNQVSQPIRECGTLTNKLLTDNTLSNQVKLRAIRNLLDKPKYKSAFSKATAFDLLRDFFMCTQANFYFANQANFNLLQECFYSCYKNDFTIIEKLVSQPDQFYLFADVMLIWPELKDYVNNKGESLSKMAAASHNTKALKYLLGVPLESILPADEESKSSEVESQLSRNSYSAEEPSTYNISSISFKKPSKTAPKPDSCCSIM